MKPLAALALTLTLTFSAAAQQFAGSQDLDEAVDAAIRANQIPGAVLLIGGHGAIIHYKAYGNRALTPTPRTDDARHHLRRRVPHQSRRNVGLHHEAFRAGQDPAR